MRNLLFVIAAALMCVALPSQDLLFDAKWDFAPDSSMVSSQQLDGAVLTTWSDGLVLLVANDLSTYSVSSMSDETNRVPQGPILDAQTPMLTTTWTDANGVTHTVQTPIPSTTPSGLTKAIDLHNQLVAALQALYPPRPITPP